ncbi:hxlR-like helix-turn-helix family protein [Asticcacaulis biprosthecium C19]|uniref:HxlR-like helix-turn-helix family protein n=2 Tax=Asticcacaulis biprosthecium TaxID=76891 RepID=F4QQS5_9CAUL|nr:hxlR-like helix-turn-helix family protein [Asticcacaulis biprosthecium C19]
MVRADAPQAKPSLIKKPAPEKSHRSMCPINLTLEKVGDSWSMLIIRDLMLRGHTGYQAFLRSEEKIATNILADRLSRLELNGLIVKKPDPADARKFIYSLTEKGADLAPLLVELALYSMKHERRTDMPKEVAAEMQRNKPIFVSRLIRANAPKSPVKRRKPEPRGAAEETLSLF